MSLVRFFHSLHKRLVKSSSASLPTVSPSAECPFADFPVEPLSAYPFDEIVAELSHRYPQGMVFIALTTDEDGDEAMVSRWNRGCIVALGLCQHFMNRRR